MRSTTRDSSVNEKTAAAEMLTMPATVVASRMDVSTGSILEPLVLCRGARCRDGGTRANRTFYRPARTFAQMAIKIVCGHPGIS
jgi:hypothetical protein